MTYNTNFCKKKNPGFVLAESLAGLLLLIMVATVFAAVQVHMSQVRQRSQLQLSAAAKVQSVIEQCYGKGGDLGPADDAGVEVTAVAVSDPVVTHRNLPVLSRLPDTKIKQISVAAHDMKQGSTAKPLCVGVIAIGRGGW